jgi:hypothetical protein
MPFEELNEMKTRNELWARLSLMSVTHMNWNFTEEEVSKICEFTVKVMPEIEMGHAVELFNAGAMDWYGSHPEDRPLLDIWVKNSDFAGLTLEEFLERSR